MNGNEQNNDNFIPTTIEDKIIYLNAFKKSYKEAKAFLVCFKYVLEELKELNTYYDYDVIKKPFYSASTDIEDAELYIFNKFYNADVKAYEFTFDNILELETIAKESKDDAAQDKFEIILNEAYIYLISCLCELRLIRKLETEPSLKLLFSLNKLNAELSGADNGITLTFKPYNETIKLIISIKRFKQLYVKQNIPFASINYNLLPSILFYTLFNFLYLYNKANKEDIREDYFDFYTNEFLDAFKKEDISLNYENAIHFLFLFFKGNLFSNLEEQDKLIIISCDLFRYFLSCNNEQPTIEPPQQSITIDTTPQQQPIPINNYARTTITDKFNYLSTKGEDNIKRFLKHNPEENTRFYIDQQKEYNNHHNKAIKTIKAATLKYYNENTTDAAAVDILSQPTIDKEFLKDTKNKDFIYLEKEDAFYYKYKDSIKENYNIVLYLKENNVSFDKDTNYSFISSSINERNERYTFLLPLSMREAFLNLNLQTRQMQNLIDAKCVALFKSPEAQNIDFSKIMFSISTEEFDRFCGISNNNPNYTRNLMRGILTNLQAKFHKITIDKTYRKDVILKGVNNDNMKTQISKFLNEPFIQFSMIGPLGSQPESNTFFITITEPYAKLLFASYKSHRYITDNTPPPKALKGKPSTRALADRLLASLQLDVKLDRQYVKEQKKLKKNIDIMKTTKIENPLPLPYDSKEYNKLCIGDIKKLYTDASLLTQRKHYKDSIVLPIKRALDYLQDNGKIIFSTDAFNDINKNIRYTEERQREFERTPIFIELILKGSEHLLQ